MKHQKQIQAMSGFSPALALSAWLAAVLTAMLFLSGLLHVKTADLLSLAGDSWFLRSIWLTIATSAVTTIICVAAGLPAAYAMSRLSQSGCRWLEKMMDLADTIMATIIVIPSSSAGLCLMIFFMYPPVLSLQDAFGMRMVHSLPGILLAQMFVAAALGIKAWKTGFDQLGSTEELVARTLGATRFYAFIKVTLPMAANAVLAGIILVFTRSVAEFGAVLLLCSSFRDKSPAMFAPTARYLGLAQADILSVGMWLEIEGGNLGRGTLIGLTLVLLAIVCVYMLQTTLLERQKCD